MSYQERMSAAKEWEATVKQWFVDRKFTIDEFGQAMLSEKMREALRAYESPALIRWLPDFIVAAQPRPFLLDAKASRPHERTGKHAVETQSSTVGLELAKALSMPIFYAFPHKDDAPAFVSLDRWIAHAQETPWMGHGSGTPFKTALCAEICNVQKIEVAS